jgi:tetracycline 7-halogenase / FADH2 O2-dependent halogenase
MRIVADIVVVGAGFGGSITAAILQQAGFKVVLLERHKHPRFAIGESSTPAASLLLNRLAEEYQLDYLRPLCKYGSWKQQLPNIRRGLKRGFSYFAHEAGAEFQSSPEHANELLVAASVSDEVGDTQWYRADVDAYLCDQAVELGVRLFELAHITNVSERETHVEIEFNVEGQTFEIETQFVVDATAGGGVMSSFRGRRQNESWTQSSFKTNTRAIFGHFDGLPKWSEVIQAAGDYPFECDDSAMHHLLNDQWMWWIRFDDGTTSVGLVTKNQTSAGESTGRWNSAEAEWADALAGFPTLRSAFDSAECSTGLHATKRLQRGFRESHDNGSCHEENWRLCLPNALGFVDPLHSTGIAHTLSGVLRVTNLLIESRDNDSLRAERIRDYTNDVRSELNWIDDLVSGCYSHLNDFPKFAAFSMCYFAAATTFERRFLEGDKSSGFLCADDKSLRNRVQALLNRDSSETAQQFEDACKEAIGPINHVGLFNPDSPNMYAYTALPE